MRHGKTESSCLKNSLAFMVKKFEDSRMENVNLKIEVYALRMDNERLNNQLMDMKEETKSSNFQLDYIEMNLKSENVEISRVPFVMYYT